VKTKWKPILITVLAAVVVLSIAGVALGYGLQGNGSGGRVDGTCSGSGYGNGASAGQGYGGQGSSNSESCTDGSCDGSVGAAVTAAPLSESEEAQLLYMREEEKLARDVYLFLYDKWGVDEFSSIAASETNHMARVKVLLNRYGLTDPVGTDTSGVFANSELQTAYNQLVAQGSVSLTAAYEVGVTIEELDIADLEILVASSTHRDITRVAQNLLRASQRHLVAFSGLLDQ